MMNLWPTETDVAFFAWAGSKACERGLVAGSQSLCLSCYISENVVQNTVIINFIPIKFCITIIVMPDRKSRKNSP